MPFFYHDYQVADFVMNIYIYIYAGLVEDQGKAKSSQDIGQFMFKFSRETRKMD